MNLNKNDGYNYLKLLKSNHIYFIIKINGKIFKFKNSDC